MADLCAPLDDASCMQGTVDVSSFGVQIRLLGRGDYFGQVALMKAGVRTASCSAKTTCEISVLHGNDLQEVRPTRKLVVSEPRFRVDSRLNFRIIGCFARFPALF